MNHEKNRMKFVGGIHFVFSSCYAFQQPAPQRTPRLPCLAKIPFPLKVANWPCIPHPGAFGHWRSLRSDLAESHFPKAGVCTARHGRDQVRAPQQHTRRIVPESQID